MRRLAVLAIALGACGTPPSAQTRAQPTATPTSTQPPEITMTDEARARDFISKLVKHDFAGATAAFDTKMATALPKEKLSAIWSQLETQAGAFKNVDAVGVTQTNGARIAAVKASFERAPLVFRVVLDDKQVVGFFVAPGDTAAAWQPPPYATMGSFEEKPIAVGSSPALPGLLAMPKNGKNVPAVVLVHGSGPNDQDETIGALKVFKDLAYGLASRGVAVLRYDKRTHVDGTNVRTQKEEVDDAVHAAIALLRAQPDVDVTRVALLGHSQGGYLAPRIAKDDPQIKRLVIFAGSTRPLEDSFVAQVRYMATLQPNEAKLKDLIVQADLFKKTVESPSLKADDRVAFPLASSIPGAYFLEVRGYHPERVAAQLSIPILVMQGERDYQVTVADDFPAWKTALGQKKNATLRTYPELNHAFTRGSGPPSPADYEKPGHVDEKVIDDIAAFLQAP